MASKFSLDGAIIPRSVKRQTDERLEPRTDADSQPAIWNCGVSSMSFT